MLIVLDIFSCVKINVFRSCFTFRLEMHVRCDNQYKNCSKPAKYFGTADAEMTTEGLSKVSGEWRDLTVGLMTPWKWKCQGRSFQCGGRILVFLKFVRIYSHWVCCRLVTTWCSTVTRYKCWPKSQEQSVFVEFIITSIYCLVFCCCCCCFLIVSAHSIFLFFSEYFLKIWYW